MSDSFTVEAKPGTDIWKKPPTTNIFDAPVARTVTGPLSKFRSARVTFWADWKELYDQGGILLVPRRKSSGQPSAASPPERWIKTGVEFYQNQPQLSTVSTDRWADWSVSKLDPLPSSGGQVTVEIVRAGDNHGRSAWVYHLVTGQSGSASFAQRVPLREICWLFADEAEGAGGADEWVLDVAALAARPAKNASGNLAVRFSEFTVKWDN